MTTTTVARTVPVALIALGTHMLEQQLPSPIAYRIPGKFDDHAFRIHLADADDLALWAASINVDSEYLETKPQLEFDYLHATGRLPYLGVSVDLFCGMEKHTLSAVPS